MYDLNAVISWCRKSGEPRQPGQPRGVLLLLVAANQRLDAGFNVIHVSLELRQTSLHVLDLRLQRVDFVIQLGSDQLHLAHPIRDARVLLRENVTRLIT